MTIKQHIKNVKAGSNITQNTDGGSSSVEQSIEDATAKGAVSQSSNNNFLHLGKFKASGVIAIIALGLIVIAYYFFTEYKN